MNHLVLFLRQGTRNNDRIIKYNNFVSQPYQPLLYCKMEAVHPLFINSFIDALLIGLPLFFINLLLSGIHFTLHLFFS
jgi:hypothetical protein